jgi:hypothetical protein
MSSSWWTMIDPPGPTCAYCGKEHPNRVCPLVKAIEYHADGKPKRVEFFAPSDYHPIAQWGPVLPGSNNQ